MICWDCGNDLLRTTTVCLWRDHYVCWSCYDALPFCPRCGDRYAPGDEVETIHGPVCDLCDPKVLRQQAAEKEAEANVEFYKGAEWVEKP
jgi:hypothetical protein